MSSIERLTFRELAVRTLIAIAPGAFISGVTLLAMVWLFGL